MVQGNQRNFNSSSHVAVSDRDTLASMDVPVLRSTLQAIDQRIMAGAPTPRVQRELEVEWCYLRRELEFRGYRRDA